MGRDSKVAVSTAEASTPSTAPGAQARQASTVVPSSKPATALKYVIPETPAGSLQSDRPGIRPYPSGPEAFQATHVKHTCADGQPSNTVQPAPASPIRTCPRFDASAPHLDAIPAGPEVAELRRSGQSGQSDSDASVHSPPPKGPRPRRRPAPDSAALADGASILGRLRSPGHQAAEDRAATMLPQQADPAPARVKQETQQGRTQAGLDEQEACAPSAVEPPCAQQQPNPLLKASEANQVPCTSPDQLGFAYTLQQSLHQQLPAGVPNQTGMPRDERVNAAHSPTAAGPGMKEDQPASPSKAQVRLCLILPTHVRLGCC